MAIRRRLGGAGLMAGDTAFLSRDSLMLRILGNDRVAIFGRRQQRYTHDNRDGEEDKPPISFAQLHEWGIPLSCPAAS